MTWDGGRVRWGRVPYGGDSFYESRCRLSANGNFSDGIVSNRVGIVSHCVGIVSNRIGVIPNHVGMVSTRVRVVPLRIVISRSQLG